MPPADADNPRGYWEPQWIIGLNDEILAKLGTVWQQPFPAAPGWERQPELDELRGRARELLREKFGSAPLWGWKDPRVMLTLPFWQELVPDARYVICLRNPADVISSFQRRPEPNLSIEAWGNLWMEFNARALKETRGERTLFVFYEDFLRDSRAQITRLASFLDLDAPGNDERLGRRCWRGSSRSCAITRPPRSNWLALRPSHRRRGCSSWRCGPHRTRTSLNPTAARGEYPRRLSASHPSCGTSGAYWPRRWALGTRPTSARRPAPRTRAAAHRAWPSPHRAGATARGVEQDTRRSAWLSCARAADAGRAGHDAGSPCSSTSPHRGPAVIGQLAPDRAASCRQARPGGTRRAHRERSASAARR